MWLGESQSATRWCVVAAQIHIAYSFSDISKGPMWAWQHRAQWLSPAGCWRLPPCHLALWMLCVAALCYMCYWACSAVDCTPHPNHASPAVCLQAPSTYDRIISIEMFEHMKNYAVGVRKAGQQLLCSKHRQQPWLLQTWHLARLAEQQQCSAVRTLTVHVWKPVLMQQQPQQQHSQLHS